MLSLKQTKCNLSKFLVLITKEGKTILQERKGKGIWQGLYQFPLIESNNELSTEQLIANSDFQETVPQNSKLTLFNQELIVHKLSHQHLYTRFWIVNTQNSHLADIDWKEINKFPVPVLISNFLDKFKSELN